jgi:uncharacterized lipoprotein YajG
MKSIPMIAAAALLAGCSSPSDIFSPSGGPADPGSRVPAQRYAPVTAGTVDYRPVDQLPWKERNEKVAPKKEQQQ